MNHGFPNIPDEPQSPRFHTTRWTMVGMAADESHREAAWNHFCGSYWYPVYAFIRRRGSNPEDARDLTQGFFTKLITLDWLAGVEKRETRFSTLLIAILKNYLINQHAMVTAEKRGGKSTLLPLDAAEAEQWYGNEPANLATPETLFEKRWALAVLEAAARRLREEYESVGKARLHQWLGPYLSREPEPGDYERAGTALGIQSKSVAVAVHRLRSDFRAMVREEVAAGLRDKSLVDEEMRALAAALGL